MEYIGLAILVLFILLFNLDLAAANNGFAKLSRLGFKLKSYTLDESLEPGFLLSKLNESNAYARQYIATDLDKQIFSLYEKAEIFFLNMNVSFGTAKNTLNDISFRYFPIFHYYVESKNNTTKLSEIVNIRIMTCFGFFIAIYFYIIIFAIMNEYDIYRVLISIAVLSFLGIIGLVACKYSCKMQRKRFAEQLGYANR